MLLFVLGCAGLCHIHYVSGIILAAIGTFFLVPRFSEIFSGTAFGGSFLSTWWPIFIIIGGLLIFFSILLKPKKLILTCHHQRGAWENNHCATQSENSDGVINYKLVFSGMEQVILDPVFKGGYIETVFGGMELDLRRTSLAEGETFLYVKAVFGGVEIKAPDNWLIEIKSDSTLGGVVDDRSKSQDMDYSKKLIVVANAVFGGVTIK
jgi:predicted membrane protein